MAIVKGEEGVHTAFYDVRKSVQSRHSQGVRQSIQSQNVVYAQQQIVYTPQQSVYGEEVTKAFEQDTDLERSSCSTEERSSWVISFLFLTQGIAQLFFWNCLLNILYELQTKIYVDHPHMTDTLNAVYNLAAIFVAGLGIVHNRQSLKTTPIALSGLFLAVCSIGCALVVQFSSGLTGVIGLHVFSLLGGLATGFYESATCALSSIMPQSQSGWVSTGQGVCGLLTFAMWQIIIHTNVSTKGALWWQMGLGTLMNAFATVFTIREMRRPTVQAQLAALSQQKEQEEENGEAMSTKEILKFVWPNMFNAWLCFTVTLFIFPNLVPLRGGMGTFTDAVSGAYQIGDLVGRYAPQFAPALVLNVAGQFITNGIRLLLMVPLAVGMWRINNPAWKSRAFQFVYMLCLALSNGFLVSSVYMFSGRTPHKKHVKARASSFTILALLIGIGCGLWSCRLVTYLVERQ